eukprot:132362-Heterocapsa_arctica.AAC.1
MKRLAVFDSFCALIDYMVNDIESLEQALLMHFDVAYLCGYPLAKGMKLLTAVEDRRAPFPFRDHEFRAMVAMAASLAELEKWK